jgi:hypothetical protein
VQACQPSHEGYVERDRVKVHDKLFGAGSRRCCCCRPGRSLPECCYECRCDLKAAQRRHVGHPRSFDVGGASGGLAGPLTRGVHHREGQLGPGDQDLSLAKPGPSRAANVRDEVVAPRRSHRHLPACRRAWRASRLEVDGLATGESRPHRRSGAASSSTGSNPAVT